MNQIYNPLIIIGMHRSGTTMITRILRETGLFVGWNLEPNYEARFFLALNQAILQACNASWDNPLPAEALLDNHSLRDTLRQNLAHDIQTFRSFYFLGPGRYLKYRSLAVLDAPWGWKDPRTTFLLPLWLDIFPGARIIHIYRNGVDVAGSLAAREHKRIHGITGRSKPLHFTTNQKNQLRENGLFLYLFNKIRTRYSKLNPFSKYSYMGVSQCISLDRGFALWCTYMDKALYYRDNLHNPFMSIRYEDFLTTPGPILHKILSFCDLPFSEEHLRPLIANLNPDRGFAFKNDEKLSAFYAQVKNHPLMINCGYNDA